MEAGFQKGNSSNLPKIDVIMLGAFLASNFCVSIQQHTIKIQK